MKHQLLIDLHACHDAQDWAEQYDTLQQAWDACDRGDWMLWLCGKLAGPPESASRKKLVLATCACARLALPYVQPGELRPLQSIETAETWARGEAGATLADVQAAYAAAAAYAAYAAYAVYAADAYAAADADAADARASTLKQCADIVRAAYPLAPERTQT